MPKQVIDFEAMWASPRLSRGPGVAGAGNRESEWKEELPSAPASVLREDG